MWWILLIATFVLLAVWGLASFWRGVKKVRTAEQEVEREIGGIEHLSVSETERECHNLLQRETTAQEWVSAIPAEIDACLAKLDPDLSAFLRRYRRITFQESGTEMSSEFLLSTKAPEGIWLVGANGADNYELGVKAQSPIIYEIAGGQVRDRYPSIFHYCLLVEGVK